MANENKTEILVIDEITLQSKIYIIREQKVMLDFELAEIYGYETKNFNRQVKNNLAKLEGDDFMFQLTDEEVEELSIKQSRALVRTFKKMNKKTFPKKSESMNCRKIAYNLHI